MEQAEGAIASFFIHPVFSSFIFSSSGILSILSIANMCALKILYNDNNLQKTLQLTEIQVGKAKTGNLFM